MPNMLLEISGDREWDGWMASLTWWTWVWVNSGSWWWTGRPGMLQFMGSQRVGHVWATELNWLMCVCVCVCVYDSKLQLWFPFIFQYFSVYFLTHRYSLPSPKNNDEKSRNYYGTTMYRNLNLNHFEIVLKSQTGTWTHVTETLTQPKPSVPGFRT